MYILYVLAKLHTEKKKIINPINVRSTSWSIFDVQAFFADASHFPPPPLSNVAPQIEGDEEDEEEEEEREVSGLGEA
jgi:hypothetical protein